MSKKDIIKRKKGETIHEAKIEGESNTPKQQNIILLIIALVFILFILLIKLFS